MKQMTALLQTRFVKLKRYEMIRKGRRDRFIENNVIVHDKKLHALGVGYEPKF